MIPAPWAYFETTMGGVPTWAIQLQPPGSWLPPRPWGWQQSLWLVRFSGSEIPLETKVSTTLFPHSWNWSHPGTVDSSDTAGRLASRKYSPRSLDFITGTNKLSPNWPYCWILYCKRMRRERQQCKILFNRSRHRRFRWSNLQQRWQWIYLLVSWTASSSRQLIYASLHIYFE